MFRLAITTLSAVLLVPPVTAGPLGMEQGMTKADIERTAKLKPEGPYQFSASSLPNGHPDFTDYRLLITPEHGLCKVVAWTSPIRASSYGEEIANTYKRFHAPLTAKYGAGKEYDFLRSGSIWKEPREWMMSLLKKERVLSTYWTNDQKTLPDNLLSIGLEAVATGMEQGLVNISYEFSNLPRCIEWIKAQKDSKL